MAGTREASGIQGGLASNREAPERLRCLATFRDMATGKCNTGLLRGIKSNVVQGQTGSAAGSGSGARKL